MKKIALILIIVVGLGALWTVGIYNSLVSGKANVDKEWSNVEVQYQRRADLVPQLQAVTAGIANFEKTTFIQVVEARAKATSTTVNISDPASLEQFQASQIELSGALSRLLVTMEAYPELNASKNFQDLQSQLEGTENRIAVSRGDYNTAATRWNISVQRVPTVFIARLFGFTVVALYDAIEGAEVAPKIDFNIE